MKITAQTYSGGAWTGEWFDLWTAFGMRMSDGLDSLRAPLEMKEVVTNQSRLEHGTRVAYDTKKAASRSHTLTFTIQGSTASQFQSRKRLFLNILYGAHRLILDIYGDGSEEYILTYTGKGCSYSGHTGKFCAMTLKFDEYELNPHFG